jgi:hypothetical protein
MHVVKSERWLNRSQSNGKFACLFHTKETRAKIANSVRQNRWAENAKNHHSTLLKGRKQSQEIIKKRIESLKGKKHSKERIEKNRQSHLGIKYPERTEEYKQKIRDLMTGRTFTESHLANVKRANQERSKVRCSCLFCQKEIDVNNFLRWHGEKCRMKPKDFI